MRSAVRSNDIAFARDDARSILPVMVACLTAFVCLLLSFSLTLSSQVGDASRASTASLQIEVPAHLASESDEMKRILTAVRATAGVTSARVIDHAAMQVLLKPWLGSNVMLGALDVPVLIDVTSADALSANSLDALKESLRAISGAISVRSKSPWQRDVARAGRLIHACLLGFSVLLIACVVGMVTLLSRTGLKLHFKSVSLLHLFGATDEYILKQFQWNITFLVARGALLGVMVAIAVFWLLQQGIRVTDNPLIPILNISVAHGVLWVALPLFISAMAMMASRFTVQHMLTTMH